MQNMTFPSLPIDERLSLDPITHEDAMGAFMLLSTYPEICAHVTFTPPKKVDETAGYFDWVLRVGPSKERVWKICLDGELIGMIGLHDIRRRDQALRLDRAEVGYWLGPAHQRQGVMTKALNRVLEYSFGEFGLRKVVAEHFVVNEASGNLLRKVGFATVGVMRDHVEKQGQLHDVVLLELLGSAYAV